MSKKPKKKRQQEYGVEMMVQLIIYKDVKASSRKQAARKGIRMALENRELCESWEPTVTVFKQGTDARGYTGSTGYGVDYDVIDGELRLRK